MSHHAYKHLKKFCPDFIEVLAAGHDAFGLAHPLSLANWFRHQPDKYALLELGRRLHPERLKSPRSGRIRQGTAAYEG